MVLIRGRRLKEEGTYLKVRSIAHVEFQNFVVFPFQITMNNYHHDIVSDVPELPLIFAFITFCSISILI